MCDPHFKVSAGVVHPIQTGGGDMFDFAQFPLPTRDGVCTLRCEWPVSRAVKSPARSIKALDRVYNEMVQHLHDAIWLSSVRNHDRIDPSEQQPAYLVDYLRDTVRDVH